MFADQGTQAHQHLQHLQHLATFFFAAAVIHTFLVTKINKCASFFPQYFFIQQALHVLGEVEIVFALWAVALLAWWSVRFGPSSAIDFLRHISFTEPVFVFVVMAIAATKPVVDFARWAISSIAALFPYRRAMALYIVTLVVGPLMGSLITEPAAMTVTALLLREHFYESQTTLPFRYVTMGLLFVNISLGGTLTHFAAPPVLMVAAKWNWTTPFMLRNFGLRAVVVIVISTVLTAYFFRNNLRVATPHTNPQNAAGQGRRGRVSDVYTRRTQVSDEEPNDDRTHFQDWYKVPSWAEMQKPSLAFLRISFINFLFLAAAIFCSHHITLLLPLFFLFWGWYTITKPHQGKLRVRESLLVGCFLAGLVTLGNLQAWWLTPLIKDLSHTTLYLSTITLTAVTDNAALTYLGTLLPHMDETARYLLVAGAVGGGGLTVIANAPNPAGYGILQPTFAPDGVNPLLLFCGALPFTLLAALVFSTPLWGF